MKKLLIIILNYRTAKLTVECLKSISAQMREEFFAVVVDNASGDDSQSAISAAIRENGWEKWCQLHVMEKNGGFSWGNNQGLKAGPDSEYILLLNSDTIVGDGCLDYCIRAMEADETIGATSCQVLNSDGSIQNVCRRMPNPLIQWISSLGLPWVFPRLFGWANIQAGEWDRTKPMDVGWIGGAFMMIRGDLVKKIGLLNESFFFYGEDVEFCGRVWKSGHRVRFDPGAQIVHLGGISSGEKTLPDLNKEKMRLRAKYLVQRLCYGRIAEGFARWSDRCRLGTRLAVLTVLGRTRGGSYDWVKSMLAIMKEV